MIPAIVLAAGASSRMGRTKALLPLPGGDTFLARIVATLRAAGVEEIVVVVGEDGASIRAAQAGAARPPCRFVHNHDPSRGQLSSLQLGLDVVAGCRGARGAGPGGDDVIAGVIVTTVDLPLVSAETVRRVIGAWRASRAPIVRPARDGRHGHPVIFDAAVFDELQRADLAVGARAVLRAHLADIIDVPVDDAGAFEDIDTPADYERLVGLPFPKSSR
jgi:molybdenum cofactor cytidylyltransferase